MAKTIISLIFLLTPLLAASAPTPVIKDNAPDRYTVVEGDTLWGIAGRFLQNPWQWPEIWKMNQEQIKNPNRIYPGDMIVLDRSSQEARLRVTRLETVRRQPEVRAEALAPRAIPAIPISVVEPFLSRPLIVGPSELDAAPRISATQENRVAIGKGAVAYASGVPPDKGQIWQIFRRGDPLIDPDTRETLGYEGVYLGDARVDKFAEESTIQIMRSAQEIYVGDRLIPTGREIPNFGYVPHPPEKQIRGRIVSTYGGLGEAGKLSIVTLSRGSQDGLEVGHVLAIYRSQSTARYDLRTSPLFGRSGPTGSDSAISYYGGEVSPRDAPMYDRGPAVTDAQIAKLPDERYGLVMVFRTFDRASFALVMQASRQVNVNDVVVNP